MGVLTGAFNGFMVGTLKVNAIITTIGTLALFRGLAFIVTDGQTEMVQNQSLLAFGSGRILGVPYSVWILIAVFAAANFLAERTTVGRSIFAIGASPRAALLAGLNVNRIRFCMFVASGVSAALAGVLLIGQSGAAVPSGATGYELQVITAVLLGGTKPRRRRRLGAAHRARGAGHRHAEQRHGAAQRAELLPDRCQRRAAARRGRHRPAADPPRQL